MHFHKCWYCEKDFMCGEEGATCKTYKTCAGCFWRIEFRWYAFVLILSAVAIGMTILAASGFSEIQ